MGRDLQGGLQVGDPPDVVTGADTPEERERRAAKLREQIERELHAQPGPPEQQPGESEHAYVERLMREKRAREKG